jgi:pyrimidine operon attenuation protein/uracil phosphoribosyltransferase
MNKNYILSAERANMKIRRMAYEILERNNGLKKLALAGIMDNGFFLAERLKLVLMEISTLETAIYYRDMIMLLLWMMLSIVGRL